MTTRRAAQGRRDLAPLSLRVTPEERRFLEARARETQQPSVSAFIRARLFGMVRADAGQPAPDGRLSPAERHRMLARILGALGGSRVFSNLSDLVEAARLGVLPVTPEVVGEIRAACAAVIEVRDLLLRALGTRSLPKAGHDR